MPLRYKTSIETVYHFPFLTLFPVALKLSGFSIHGENTSLAVYWSSNASTKVDVAVPFAIFLTFQLLLSHKAGLLLKNCISLTLCKVIKSWAASFTRKYSLTFCIIVMGNPSVFIFRHFCLLFGLPFPTVQAIWGDCCVKNWR